MIRARPVESNADVPRWVITLADSGTVFLALGGFWLSYLALQDLARRSGLPVEQAWVWPLIVDGVIVEATVAVVAMRHASLSARAFAWGLLCAGASVSVAANVTHAIVAADADVPMLVAAAVSSVPPLVLLAMTHLTVLLTRHSTPNHRPESDSQGQETSSPEPSGAPVGVAGRPRRTITRGSAVHDGRAQAIQLHRDGSSKRQIAVLLGVHPTTIGRWLSTPDTTQKRTEEEQL